MKIGEVWIDNRSDPNLYFYGQVKIENIYKNYVQNGIHHGECVGFTILFKICDL